MTTIQRIELAILDAVAMARLLIPIDTGNMRYNAFKVERVNETTWQVYIDEKIAPYAVYVNEKWVSPKWNGKANPNEGFWKKAFEFIADQIATAINGKIIWR